MREQTKSTLTSYFNNLVELEVNSRWGDDVNSTPKERAVRRTIIILNPRDGINNAVRQIAERRLGVRDTLYEAFPAGLIKITLNYIAYRMNKDKCTIEDLIPNWCRAEENTPAAFPKMLAFFASEWLTKQERWKTKRFKKLIAYLERRQKQKQNEAE